MQIENKKVGKISGVEATNQNDTLCQYDKQKNCMLSKLSALVISLSLFQ